MSTDRKSLLYLIIIMCVLWIASLVVIFKSPREVRMQQDVTFPVATPTLTVYRPPTPTNTRVIIAVELTPGKSEFIEMLPTLPPDPNFTPVPGVTSSAKQVPAPIDVRELDVYKEIQK